MRADVRVSFDGIATKKEGKDGKRDALSHCDDSLLVATFFIIIYNEYAQPETRECPMQFYCFGLANQKNDTLYIRVA
jgi:hypothetical protein